MITSYEINTGEGFTGFTTLGPALEAAWLESASGAGEVIVYAARQGEDVLQEFAVVRALTA